MADEAALAEERFVALTQPGAPYEIGSVNVEGVEVPGFLHGDFTMPHFLEKYTHKHASLDFLVLGDSRITFGDFFEKMRSFGLVLRDEFRVSLGDRVAIAMRNSFEWCIAYCAIIYIGAVCVPLNSWWKGAELAYGIRDSGSKVLVCDPARYRCAKDHFSRSELQMIITQPCQEAPPHIPLFSALVTHRVHRSVRFDVSQLTPEDTVCIMYTSGTTGHPKGVVLTHRGMINQMKMSELVDEIAGYVQDQVGPSNVEPAQQCVICPVPLFHVTASHHIFLSSFVPGRKVVLMSKWNPEVALKLVEIEKATSWTGVPTMLQDLIEHPMFKSTDTSSLISAGSGGAATPPSLIQKVSQAFNNAQPSQGYGLTETNGAVSWIRGQDFIDHPASCGRPFPIVECKIIDVDTQEELQSGVGELVVKSTLILREYWNKPQETADAIITINDSPRWFRTGDIARLDEDGYIYIMDRAKDIIIRGGENISCVEVEAAIHEHPSVMEVAVFSIPHPRLGEAVACMVMCKRHAKVSASTLRRFLLDRLAAFKVPEEPNIHYTDSPLPRGATGKVHKRTIRKQLLSPKPKL